MKSFFVALISAFLLAGQVFLPASAAGLHAQLPSEACGITYAVQPGDTLSTNADDCDSTVKNILALKPEITNPNLIFIGQRLQISGSVSEIEAHPTAYIVEAGETLDEIARLFGVTVGMIRRANPSLLFFSQPIYAGMVLYIPAASAYTEFPRVSIGVTTAGLDEDVIVYVRGFPANSRIDYRLGKVDGEEIEILDIYDGIVDAHGYASEIITLPLDAEEGDLYVIQVATTSQKDAVEVTSHTIYIDDEY
jgi:LysM repeat protein